MSEPFIGEIRIFPFNFAPKGWAMCNGQIMLISQNTALFSLIGTFYGGDGITTFALPDLRGRVAIHNGQGPALSDYLLGEVGGSESVTLTVVEMPAHAHHVAANAGSATTGRPDGAVPARTTGNTYAAAPDGTAMNAGMITATGGSLPHPNLQPFLALNLCIALFGIFPSRN